MRALNIGSIGLAPGMAESPLTYTVSASPPQIVLGNEVPVPDKVGLSPAFGLPPDDGGPAAGRGPGLAPEHQVAPTVVVKYLPLPHL